MRLDLGRDQPAVVDAKLAVLAAADRGSEGRVATVDLGCGPPVRVVVDVGWRPTGIGARVAAPPTDLHRVLGPRVTRVERNEPRVLALVLPVAEPVVHLELDPRACEQVQRRRRNELVPGEELAADLPRVWLEV